MHSHTAALATLTLTAPALAGGPIQIDETYFAGAPFVGVDPIPDPIDTPLTVGFDFNPDGSPITTPNNIGTALFFSDPIETAFAPVGLLIDPGSRAVSQPINPSGIGAMSGENVLASDIDTSPSGTIVFTFTNGVSAAGFFAVDGPTNEATASFFDTTGALLTTLVPLPEDTGAYLGIESDIPIGSIVISSIANDDYYVENLSFINVPECPADFDPNAILDFNDVVAYLTAFSGADPAADLAAPFGTLDFNDVIVFLTLFAAGCP